MDVVSSMVPIITTVHNSGIEDIEDISHEINSAGVAVGDDFFNTEVKVIESGQSFGSEFVEVDSDTLVIWIGSVIVNDVYCRGMI